MRVLWYHRDLSTNSPSCPAAPTKADVSISHGSRMSAPHQIEGLPKHALGQRPIIGKGFTSDVYEWEPGRVLKLFHAGAAAGRIEREFLATRAVHALGLPAPAAYELVEVDGRYGIVLERVEGVSLYAQVQARPWMLFAAVRRLAELHVRISSSPAPAGLPSQRDWIAGKIDACAAATDSEKRRARERLNALPDGDALCHGDFHPANVFETARGPVVIDWETATCGHPAGDAACTCLLIRHASLPEEAPRHMRLLLAATRKLIHRGYLNAFVRAGLATPQQIAAWQQPLAAAAARWRAKVPEGSGGIACSR